MANTAGNRFVLYTDLTPNPTTRLTKVSNFNASPTTITADSETNEDAGNEAHDIIGGGDEWTFELLVDIAEPSHVAFLNAWKNKQKIYARYVERGNVTGADREEIRCSISLRKAAQKKDLVKYNVTLKRDGATTFDTHTAI